MGREVQPFVTKFDDLPPPNAEQRRVLDAIEKGHNVFITGQAGTGKSLTLAHLKEYFDEKSIRFAMTAPTGIAALSLGGTTIHSWAGVGTGNKPVDAYINPRDRMANAVSFNAIDVLIIDEISMVSSFSCHSDGAN